MDLHSLNSLGIGVTTIYADTRSGYTGFAVFIQGGGGSGVGAAGTWQNDQLVYQLLSSVGVNIVRLMIQIFKVLVLLDHYKVGNGMIVNDNQLNGDHYIGTASGGMMARPLLRSTEC